MKVGFIGLGNVGGKLAGSLLRNGIDLTVLDQKQELMAGFAARGAGRAENAAQLMRENEVVITCLPSPAASAAVMDEMLPEVTQGKTWLEMSTTDEAEIRRLADLVTQKGGTAVDCPVSGGCHRADTGNISIFAGCDRPTFEKVLPLLTRLGRRVLHTGDVGTASTLKVMTNYLATINLLSCCEALATMKAAGMDMATTYEAIKISSGTSFVHETESQLILNGSRDVNFTMDLILKDTGLFQTIAERNNVPLDLSPMVIDIMKDGQKRYGERANSDDIIRRLEDATGLSILADGFPAELIDDEPEEQGYEVFPPGSDRAVAAE
ncbi:MAG: NAD(P)-dependent oxidoreductase [Sulfitobacter sp.]